MTPEMKIRKAEVLLQAVRKEQQKESRFELTGVRNLSRGDLDAIELYCETFDGYRFPGLAEPMGNIKDALIGYKVVDKEDPIFSAFGSW